MLGTLFQRPIGLLSAAEKARLMHSRWLSRALAERGRAWPVIPLRRVSEGGFSAMLALPQGRAWAERWWEEALVRLED